MEKKISKSDMPMKTSEVKIGKTVYLVSTNSHLLDEKTILNKFKRVLLSEVRKENDNT